MEHQNTHITPENRPSYWGKLLPYEKYADQEFPKVSIIIPTVNSAQLISMTLEKVLAQDYPSYEIIIVDSSTDRTLENVKHFQSDKIRIYSVLESTRFEMLNRGVLQANGEYICILFPGDFYIYQGTLKWMMGLALNHQKPEMVYCGTLIREGWRDPKILFREFTKTILENGQQPTSLQACWFRTDILREMSRFDPDFNWRGGFELMCRFKLESKNRIVATRRVLIDYDLRLVTRSMVMSHFWETFRTIYRYFGFKVVMKWMYNQDDTKRYMRLLMRNIKVAFAKR